MKAKRRTQHLKTSFVESLCLAIELFNTSVTSPAVLRAFRHLNTGQTYADQIKPFNFLLTVAGAKPPASVPKGVPFRLVARFSTDPDK